MSLFDTLVSEALKNQRDLAPLRVVVEKEILHHDILREMSTAGLLDRLTFIGGTCLRACYCSSRLSEDLDFTSFTVGLGSPSPYQKSETRGQKTEEVCSFADGLKNTKNTIKPKAESFKSKTLHLAP